MSHASEMSIRDDRWFSVEEIAEHLGVTKDPVYRWIERKGLPERKVGKLWKFKKDEVDEWVHPVTRAKTARRGSGDAGRGALNGDRGAF